MADMKLFRLDKNDVEEIAVRSIAVEKILQSLIERHFEKFLSVRFLTSGYSRRKTHKGHMVSRWHEPGTSARGSGILRDLR
jgi:hypothetical protein